MAERTFVGFGFGAIQAGLFLYEARRSGHFDRLVVAEILPEVVAAVRAAGGRYRLNIATPSDIRVERADGVELLNPQDPGDAPLLAQALAQASEICTALPSVDFYDRGEPSVATLLAGAIQRKVADPGLPACVVYTAENHNHAAEILQALCERETQASPADRSFRVQFLNTVIGKMSGVVSGPDEIASQRLMPVVPGFPKAFLVEEFNRILISRITLRGFRRGIEVFVEKPDLLPFEEAKLYGHNAVHALLGYLAHAKGYRFMSEAAKDEALMKLAREAFLLESGGALIARHRGVDPLFTPDGYSAYAEDLLKRMTNPWLRDQTARIIRDTPRKLGWNDRLIGTMRLALDAGVTPRRFALGVAAALEALAPAANRAEQLRALWPEPDQPPGRKAVLIELTERVLHT
jgi:mannitol-1-phosphate 5-dehydrogenase